MIIYYTVDVIGSGIWTDVTDEELNELKSTGVEYTILYSSRRPKYN
jgi:hypothetical protein